MTQTLNVGDKIPSFSIKDYEEIEVESEDLMGSPFVLYFYPKDDTPGCTLQANAFRDKIEEFDNHGVLVFGVSGDDSACHHRFIQKHGLNFTLLCDEDLTLAKKFGALTDKGSILRTTFFIDSNGIIRWIEKPVNVEGHVERVLEAVRQYN